MNRLLKTLAVAGFASLALLVGFLFTAPGRVLAQNVACYMSQGGAAWTAGSGCTLTVASGGTLAVASGGAFTINGSSVLIARGQATLDGSNPTYVTTGLTTIAGCAVTQRGEIAPTSLASSTLITYSGSTGQLILYAWRPTSASVTTYTASTGVEVIGWICGGS